MHSETKLGFSEKVPARENEREFDGAFGQNPETSKTKRKEGCDPQTCLEHIRDNMSEGVGGIEGLPDAILGNMAGISGSAFQLILIIYFAYELYKFEVGREMIRAMLFTYIHRLSRKATVRKREPAGQMGDSVRRCNL